MLDATLAAALLSALKPGASLVLVGDPDQLPPVGPGAFLEDAVSSSFDVQGGGASFGESETSAAAPASPPSSPSSNLNLLLPRVHLSRRFRQSSRSAIVDAAVAAHAGRAPLPLYALNAEELLYRRANGVVAPGSSSPLPLPSEALLVVPGTLRNSNLPSSSLLLPAGYEHELRAVLTSLLPGAGFDPVSDVQVRLFSSSSSSGVVERRKKKPKLKTKQKLTSSPNQQQKVLSPVRAGALGTRRIGAFVRDLLNPSGKSCVGDGLGNVAGGGGGDLLLPGGGGGNGGSGSSFASGQQQPPLSLRRGDKVMQTTNNYDSDVFNGDARRRLRRPPRRRNTRKACPATTMRRALR